MRIYIIGNSCTGKSTLARELSQELKIPWYSTDDIFWLHKFHTSRPKEERLPMLHAILSTPNWIIEGASTSWTADAVAAADIVVELKMHPVRLIARALRRHVRRKLGSGEGEETLRGVLQLCKYILDNEREGSPHRQRYIELLTHIRGERVTVASRKHRQALLEKLRHAVAPRNT
jgi:hypothetical protein